jgi:hypothetical protein
MRIKTIAVTYGRKFNLKNYNSLNIEVSAWADLDVTHVVDETGVVIEERSENVAEAYEQLFYEVRKQVKEYYLRATGVKPAGEPTPSFKHPDPDNDDGSPYVPNIDPNE